MTHETDDILKVAEAKGGPTARRLAAALVAFNPKVSFESTEARMVLIAAVLGLGVAEVEAAFDELVEIGAAWREWLS